jgi:hypothetical protein
LLTTHSGDKDKHGKKRRRKSFKTMLSQAEPIVNGSGGVAETDYHHR